MVNYLNNKELNNSKKMTNKFTLEEKNKLIIEYAPLIRFIAQKISVRLPSSIELDDLISSGVIGLIDAIDKYDQTRNNKFKTYAEFRIRGSILDELRAQDWVPRSIRDKSKALDRTLVRMEAEMGRSPTDREIADRMGLSMEEFFNLVNQVRPVSLLSIDDSTAFSSVDKRSIFNLLENCKINNPLIRLSAKSVQEIVTKAIESLPERQRVVLSLYYYEDMNLKEIGQTLRVTESRISQLHAQAIVRLRAKLIAHFGHQEGVA